MQNYNMMCLIIDFVCHILVKLIDIPQRRLYIERLIQLIESDFPIKKRASIFTMKFKMNKL